MGEGGIKVREGGREGGEKTIENKRKACARDAVNVSFSL